MKRILCLFLIFFCICIINAQNQKRIYLFEKYTKGKVLLRNHSIVPVNLNYDAANCNMMYVNGNDEMILENIHDIDTVYVGNSKFIPASSKGFLEMVNLKNGIIYIFWKLTNQYLGKKGAYGQIMQGSAASIDINMVKQQAGYDEHNRNITDVYAMQNENEYWLHLNGKFVKCKNEKSLLKLFLNKEEQIKEYIKKHNLNWNNTQHVIDLLDFCLGLY